MDDRSNTGDLINTDDVVTTDTNNPVATNSKNLTASPTNTENLTTSLITRMHALPPELFDTIKDLVITHPPTTKVAITATYKPPIQLQISHTTREAFATAYYSTTKFTFQDFDSADCFGRKFIVSLPIEHRRLIKRHYLMGVDGSCSAGVMHFSGVSMF